MRKKRSTKWIKCHSATQVSTKEGSLKHWIWNSVSRGACWCPPLGNGELVRTGGRQQRAKAPVQLQYATPGACSDRSRGTAGLVLHRTLSEMKQQHTPDQPGSGPRGGRSKCSHGQLLTASLTCSFTSLKCTSFVSFPSIFSVPALPGASKCRPWVAQNWGSSDVERLFIPILVVTSFPKPVTIPKPTLLYWPEIEKWSFFSCLFRETAKQLQFDS